MSDSGYSPLARPLTRVQRTPSCPCAAAHTPRIFIARATRRTLPYTPVAPQTSVRFSVRCCSLCYSRADRVPCRASSSYFTLRSSACPPDRTRQKAAIHRRRRTVPGGRADAALDTQAVQRSGRRKNRRAFAVDAWAHVPLVQCAVRRSEEGVRSRGVPGGAIHSFWSPLGARAVLCWCSALRCDVCGERQGDALSAGHGSASRVI